MKIIGYKNGNIRLEEEYNKKHDCICITDNDYNRGVWAMLKFISSREGREDSEEYYLREFYFNNFGENNDKSVQRDSNKDDGNSGS